ncbi:MAG: hypothetical protein ACRD0G_16395 [Acidimicrobiales bacterium]
MATIAVSAVRERTELSFAHTVRLGAALATAGAGFLHLDAAGDHTEHAHIAAFFVAAGVAQFAAAAAIAQREASRRAVLAAVAVNAALLATWVVSRTVGLGFVPGIDGVEAIGWKDVAAAGLELGALATLGLALVMPAAAAAALIGPRLVQRVVASMAAATLAFTIPGALVAHDSGTHEHGDDGDAAHGHGELASAVEVHDHTGDPAAGEAHAHEAGAGSADSGHVHGEVTQAAATAGDGHDHGSVTPAASGGHVHGDATGAADGQDDGHDHATEPAADFVGPQTDPLAGPGSISTMRLGPIPLLPTLPGFELPHMSPAVPFVGPGRLNLLPLVGIPAPCSDCYVLGIRPDLVYADGSPANLDTGPMLHHAVFTDLSRDDPVCGRDTLIGQLGQRVFAVGNERTGAGLPEGFGMPVGSGPWGGVLELMNMSNQVRTVFIEATVRWVPRSTPGIQPVTPVWLDIDSCGDSEVDIGAGVTDIPWEWQSNLSGRIVAAGGHVHDGGEWLSLHNSTTAEHVCTSVAGYGTKPAYMGSIESMSTCSWDRLGIVRAGDTLLLNAHYNTASAQVGVMGIMMIFVHETDDLVAGTQSPYPSDPPADGDPPDAGHHH